MEMEGTDSLLYLRHVPFEIVGKRNLDGGKEVFQPAPCVIAHLLKFSRLAGIIEQRV